MRVRFPERTIGVGTKATNIERRLLICSCAHDSCWHGWIVQALIVHCWRFTEKREGGRGDAEKLKIRSYRL